MLANSFIFATIPVVDLERARQFYKDKLGLKETKISFPEATIFKAGYGTKIYLYQRRATNCDHTMVSFEVDNIEKVVKGLKEKDVEFIAYDLPDLKTDEDNIARFDGEKSAWFRDSEGNTLCVSSK